MIIHAFKALAFVLVLYDYIDEQRVFFEHLGWLLDHGIGGA